MFTPLLRREVNIYNKFGLWFSMVISEFFPFIIVASEENYYELIQFYLAIYTKTKMDVFRHFAAFIHVAD